MKAWQLISDRGFWTTGTRARDAGGSAVAPNSPEAVCWCANGAIDACYRHPADRRYMLRLARETAVARHNVPLSRVNDRMGHEYALSILRDLDI